MCPLKQIVVIVLLGILSGCTVYYPPYPADYAYPYQYPYPNYANTAYPEPGSQGAEEPYCREYMHKVTVEGRLQEAHGTACRMPDGTWKAID